MKQVEIDEIYELIWLEKSQNLTSYAHNKLFLLAGQPGSGKTALRNYTQGEFSHDVMIVNSDELRERHPDFVKWTKEDPKSAPLRAQKIAAQWMQKLIHQAIEQRFNLLLDGTLSGKVEPILATIQLCKDTGYETEIRFLAVHEKISRLGIYLRFEEQIRDKGYGRFVDAYTHDSSYQKVPENLQSIYTSGLLDSLIIYGKGKGADNIKAITTYGDFMDQTLSELIDKLRLDNLKESQAEYDALATRLLLVMEQRSAPLDYISEFKSRVDLTF